ncbi:hypothetical protein ACTFIZ_012280 [Dictyostelium cf. discoideum]
MEQNYINFCTFISNFEMLLLNKHKYDVTPFSKCDYTIDCKTLNLQLNSLMPTFVIGGYFSKVKYLKIGDQECSNGEGIKDIIISSGLFPSTKVNAFKYNYYACMYNSCSTPNGTCDGNTGICTCDNVNFDCSTPNGTCDVNTVFCTCDNEHIGTACEITFIECILKCSTPNMGYVIMIQKCGTINIITYLSIQ